MTLHPVLAPVVLAILVLVLVGVLLGAWYRRPIPARRLAGLTVATVLLVLAALRPEIGDGARTLPAGAADDEPTIFLLIDRSPAMGVTDAARRSRMAAARDDAAAVLDAHPRARVAVVTFASTPTLEWPLSQDNWTLRSVLGATAPRSGTEADLTLVNAAAANTLLRYQLIAARQQFPRARNLVFYFGSGADGTRSPPREFLLADGSVDGGAVFGYGSPGGGPVPGSTLRSAVDESALRAVAEQIGVPYVARPGGGDTAALDNADVPEASAPPPKTTAEVVETYWLPAMLAAVLLALEAYHVLRGLRRTRPSFLRDTT